MPDIFLSTLYALSHSVLRGEYSYDLILETGHPSTERLCK